MKFPQLMCDKQRQVSHEDNIRSIDSKTMFCGDFLVYPRQSLILPLHTDKFCKSLEKLGENQM